MQFSLIIVLLEQAILHSITLSTKIFKQVSSSDKVGAFGHFICGWGRGWGTTDVHQGICWSLCKYNEPGTMSLWSAPFLLCATECLSYSRIHSLNTFALILDNWCPIGLIVRPSCFHILCCHWLCWYIGSGRPKHFFLIFCIAFPVQPTAKHL